MSDPENRIFRSQSGAWYQVRMSPVHPRTGGHLRGMCWLDFTDLRGRWMGAAPVDRNRTVASLDEEELQRFLEEAWGKRNWA